MKRSLSVILAAGALALAFTLPPSSAQEGEGVRPPQPESHSDWVLKTMKRMESVKVGLTRADLLKVFDEEGGLSTRQQRTYVYRGCPYFKVDVKFQAVGVLDEEGAAESPDDEIVEVSKPYLDYRVAD
jgi:hypothetical protein